MYAFFSSVDFFKPISLRNAIRVSNSLDQEQAQRFVWPDLSPNCLQRLEADDNSRQRVCVIPVLCFRSPIRG